MGIKIGALKEADKQLASKDGGIFMNQKAVGEETLFRPTPNSPNMKDLPYFHVVRWWINRKPFVSYATFGRPCVIEQELAEAKQSDDEDICILADDDKAVSRKDEYWWPGILLKESGDDVVPVGVRVLTAGPALAKRMTKVCMSKIVQNKTEDGIADLDKGNIISLSKTGTGMQTEYDAQPGVQWSVPKNLRVETIDAYQLAKDQLKSNDYLRAVIRLYLYGEPIPDALEQAEKDRTEKRKKKYEAALAERKKAAGIKSTKPAEAEETEEDEAPAPKPVAKKAVAPKKVVVEETVEDDAPFEDEDSLDDDLDEVPAPKTTPKKSVTKAVVKPRNLEDDLLSDDDEDNFNDD